MTEDERRDHLERTMIYETIVKLTQCNCQFAQAEDILTIMCKRQQAVWLREAAALVCHLCREGYPLQANGGWHNDRKGKDTLINNSCRAVQVHAKVQANLSKGRSRTDTQEGGVR